MKANTASRSAKDPAISSVLVAIDFSSCSRRALQKAKELLGDKTARIVALHVIDVNFVQECVQRSLDEEGAIKKRLFAHAKEKMRNFLHEEGFEGENVEPVVCTGTPFLEINKFADRYDADLIVMGSCGMVGDTEAIFFGGTTEKVLRFLSRPVLCIPPNAKNGSSKTFSKKSR